MIVKSKNGTFRAIKGRIGDFIFRTYKDGRISMYFAPAKHRTNPEPSSDQLREILKLLNLEPVTKQPKSKRK